MLWKISQKSKMKCSRKKKFLFRWLMFLVPLHRIVDLRLSIFSWGLMPSDQVRSVALPIVLLHRFLSISQKCMMQVLSKNREPGEKWNIHSTLQIHLCRGLSQFFQYIWSSMNYRKIQKTHKNKEIEINS